MGDRKSSKKDIGHLNKHLKSTLHGPIEIKDEAYCQEEDDAAESSDEYDKNEYEEDDEDDDEYKAE